jgi:uncharacterized protein YoxC
MSYLPDDPTRDRQPELFPPMLYPDRGTARMPARGGAWSNYAFGGTVVLLGCAAALLLAWGNYVGAPLGGNTEKLLQGQLAVPKLKGEALVQQPPAAAPIQLAAADPAPVPMATSATEKTETPGLPGVDVPALPPTIEPPPVSLPLKIDTPVAQTSPPVPVLIEAPAVFPPPPAPMKIELPASAPLPPTEAAQPLPDLEQPSPVFLGRANFGETPMIRTWKTLTLYSLLAVAPVVTPTPAVAGGDEKQQKRIDEMLGLMSEAIKSMNSVSQGIGEVRKDVKAVQSDVDNLKGAAVKLRADVDGSAVRLDDLNKLIGNLQADVSFLKRQLAKAATQENGAPADRAAVEELKKHLVSIEQAILKLRPAEPTTSRVALSPPAATGRVILANMYHEEMLFVINQKTYRVAPGGIVPLESPAGAIEYEVVSPTWGQRARSRTNLPPNETFTLTAR